MIDKRNKYKGFTLVEAMLATVILGMAASGVLLPFSSGASIQEEGILKTNAAQLGSDLMEDIVNTPFDEIISTYASYDEAIGNIMIVNPGGDRGKANNADHPRLVEFGRTASCEYVFMPQQSNWGASAFIMATVTVYYDGVEMVEISRLIGEKSGISVLDLY
jgi:prepilin-type N-terminal cleavage/methylation domain-containing protein